MEGGELRGALAGLAPGEAERVVAGLSAGELRALAGDWATWAHAGQRAPAGDDWRVWLIKAGRGFGKTRAGAEWVVAQALARPGTAIALVGATIAEAKAVMVEGRSGLLAVAAEKGVRARWAPGRGRIGLPGGSEAFVYSGAKGDGLRRPEHHLAWCDELAKWSDGQAAWDNLMLGLRLGTRPRAVVTTTPRRSALLSAIIADPDTVTSGGATRDNPHLPGRFVAAMERVHKGTRLGRQELEGELIGEAEGALWPRDLIARCRRVPEARALGRVVVGVDPPASAGGTCGIVACAAGRDGAGYVVADDSVGGVSPEAWARAVARAAARHGASEVIAEANNGGAMVASVMRGAGLKLPIRLVHASEGKAARAAPVAALFEAGRAFLAGRFPALEEELAGLAWGGAYEGPGRSPDRADAMVWAMSALMLGRQGAPAVRMP